MSSLKTFKAGQFLFREGETSQSLYLIKKGSVGVRKAKGSGHVELARLYTNEVVGELSFFDRQPRSASAVAINEVEVMEITFESLDKIYQEVPDYLRTIMASVSDRLRKADETIRRLKKTVQDELDEATVNVEAVADSETEEAEPDTDEGSGEEPSET